METKNKPQQNLIFDYLIVGAGIIGMAIAREIKQRKPEAKVAILEKESLVAKHGSGRNSGVLHAGFYYTENSLKAKFTKEGNAALRMYCNQNHLKINECGKVVVAQTEADIVGVKELFRRAQINNVEVSMVDTQELKIIEPNAKTVECALYSPSTATVDPVAIMQRLQQELEKRGVVFFLAEGYKKRMDAHTITSTQGRTFSAGKIINAAGLYADQIAKDFKLAKNFTIIPFKGIYLKYTGQDFPIKTNIYPVPNLENPFLGVHYTVTVDGTIKIGPTAIPAFWRENYQGWDAFNLKEFLEILAHEARLLLTDQFNFRKLAFTELRKYNKNYFVNLAANMVKSVDKSGFTEWSKPGIRAQLLNTKTMQLVQDFCVEEDQSSIHILNAVSPAFTCSFPFAAWVVERYVLKNEGEK